MGLKRRDKQFQGGDAQRRDAEPKKLDFDEAWNEGHRINDIRDKWQRDFLAFYNECLARPIRNRKTKQMQMQSLGHIHLIMRDFLTVHIPEEECEKHTDLNHWLPPKDENGDFPETWIYYKTLDSQPEVASGSDNKISRMFYESFWQGAVIRVCGDGFIKCLLAPRGHLKSHVAGMYDTLWNCIRHPEERNVIRSITTERARVFLNGIKHHFEQNQKFIDVFGHLKPEKREAAWNTEQIQLLCANRRGPDHTIVSHGMESDGTGSHGDNYVNDDISGESNTLTAALRAKARGIIEKQGDMCDPGSNLTDVGTRWEEDDAHCMFVGKPGEGSHSGIMAAYTSFMVCTVLDGDESVKVNTKISPLGYGKPIWGERWTIQTVAQKRASKHDDRYWCGQYYNQFFGTSNRLFKKEWVRRFDLQGQSMLEFAASHRLNITIGADTASGLPTTAERAKRDDTGVLVLGQTQDKKRIYVLDGCREKLPVELISKAILDLCEKWYSNSKSYGGLFRAGFEGTKWKKLLQPILSAEQRRRGLDSLFPVEVLSHENAPKCERIRILVDPYAWGTILWPENLMVPSLLGREAYDLCQLLEGEFTAYNPYATEDNLLDAHAYAFKIAQPTEFKEEIVRDDSWRALSKPDNAMPGDYSRVLDGNSDEMEYSLGGYEKIEDRA